MQPMLFPMPDRDHGPTALLAKLSALLDAAGDDPVELSLTLGTTRVSIKVESLSQSSAGRMLSDAETAIVSALRSAGEPLVGKQIAARIGRDYDRDPKLKHLLLNLEDRGVLCHQQGVGYFLPTTEAEPTPVAAPPRGRTQAGPMPLQLSEREEKIVRAIQAAGEPLVGKQVATRLGIEHDTKLRYLLMTLEERSVLLHEDGKGYSVNPAVELDEAEAA